MTIAADQFASKAASVRFENVSKTYGKSVLAVDSINLTVNPGELVTLLGPSGCGKTTTLRMIAGLEIASGGRIMIDDVDVTNLPATDRDVSMVFQSYALFPHMNVLDNVSYGLGYSGFSKTETRSRALAGLEMVGLQDFAKRLPSELSGGQQQRVAVARALVLEPQVLLFDEPLSNLDSKLRRHMREEIREIQQSLGLTVVYVTHDQEEALAVSDRIVVMRNASIAQEGTPRELYDEPVDAFVADFIGEANLLSCQIEDVKDGIATVLLEEYRYHVNARELRPGTAQIAVRPSQVILKPSSDRPSLLGKISRATYVGSVMEYRVETSVGAIFATASDVFSPLKTGQLIDVTFVEQGPVLIPQV